MTQMSARARALLERAQGEAAPSAHDLKHLRARLSASLPSQMPDPPWVPPLNKLVGVAMLAAVSMGAWQLRGVLAEHERAAAPRPAVMRYLAEPSGAAVSRPPVPTCTPVKGVAGKGVAPVPTEAARADDGRAAAARRGVQHDLFSVEAAQKEPSLELELLVLAREALDEGSATDALGHALRHEELYPESAFEEERLAIEVLAYCSAGDKERASKRFERLIELAPETSYLPRVRNTCGKGFGRASESEP